MRGLLGRRTDVAADTYSIRRISLAKRDGGGRNIFRLRLGEADPTPSADVGRHPARSGLSDRNTLTAGGPLLASLVGFRSRISVGRVGSPNALMGVVVVSRLPPPCHSTSVSDVDGLAVLGFWRFAVAAVAGSVPTSLPARADRGSEWVTGEADRILSFGTGARRLVPDPAGVASCAGNGVRGPGPEAATWSDRLAVGSKQLQPGRRTDQAGMGV